MVSHGCRPGPLGIVVDQSRGNGALAFHQALEPQQKIIRAIGKFGALAGMTALAPDCFAFSLALAGAEHDLRMCLERQLGRRPWPG